MKVKEKKDDVDNEHCSRHYWWIFFGINIAIIIEPII